MAKVGASNCLTGSINVVTLIFSILLLSGGIFLSRNVDKHKCGGNLLVEAQWVAIGIGIAGILISIAGFIGSCFRIKWLLIVYLIGLFLFILLLVVDTIILFVDVNRADDIPRRLQSQVNNPRSWNKVTVCFRESAMCRDLPNGYEVLQTNYPKMLDPIEAGCCKPPRECNFVFQNGTWVPPATGITSSNPDCRRWSTNENQLCFQCNSCKTGFVQQFDTPRVRLGYKAQAIGSLIVLLIMLAVFFIGFKAYQNVKRHREDHHHHRTHDKVEMIPPPAPV